MAALTSSITRLIKGALSIALEISDAVAVKAGGFVGIRGPNHATTQGDCAPYATENGMIFAGGHHDIEDTGDASAGSPPESRFNIGGKIYPRLTVAGTSDRGDIMALVYASNDNDLTLTRPAKGGPVGIITEYHSDDSVDVLFFGLAIQSAIYLSGAGKVLLNLGVICAELSAAGDLLKGVVAPFHGKITDFYAVCASAPADANVHMDINLEVGGTPVTGGVVTLDFADTLALKKSGTAITAENVVHEGDLIDVEAAASGFVAGTVADGFYNLYVEIEPLLGA